MKGRRINLKDMCEGCKSKITQYGAVYVRSRTDLDYGSILKDFQAGARVRDLAVKYGRTDARIYQILKDHDLNVKKSSPAMVTA